MICSSSLSILTSFKTPFELPRTLYFSTKPVVLKFAGDINLNPPPACAFPCLRILGLRGVILANQDSLSLPSSLPAGPPLFVPHIVWYKFGTFGRVQCHCTRAYTENIIFRLESWVSFLQIPYKHPGSRVLLFHRFFERGLCVGKPPQRGRMCT